MIPSHDDEDSLSTYDYSDFESVDFDSIFGTSAANSTSVIKLGGNPLSFDHNGKPLTYKTALQCSNVANWIAANSAEFLRLIHKTKTKHPIMHDKLNFDRKIDITCYNRTTKMKLSMVYVLFKFQE